jgi:hypothetical protein
MMRRLAPAALALTLIVGCAGPSKLAQRSEEKLAGGELWRAWELATKALDKEPGNARARAAAASAGSAIARDWQQRIHALADVDSVDAAEQVLEFASFRANAVRYAVVSVDADWSRQEQGLRRTAARAHYQRGTVALGSRRPKKAYLHFTEAERFVTGYANAVALAERAYEKAITRVAFVPFRTSSRNTSLGREVAARWRDDLARELAPPAAHFTRILGGQTLDEQMTLAQLDGMSSEQAVRLGRNAGAERIVCGSIGGVNADTRLHFFRETIAQRTVFKAPDGGEVVRWVDIPIEVVARERTVTVDVDYDVISTQGGASLAHQRAERTTRARVVWTSYQPQGNLEAYALVSETLRTADPERAKQVEARWKSVCGEQTTLRQVLEARRSTRSSARYGREALPRFIAGAAFVFLEDLPPAEDLAFAALAGGWKPLRDDLLRLDTLDDADLGVAAVGTGAR